MFDASNDYDPFLVLRTQVCEAEVILILYLIKHTLNDLNLTLKDLKIMFIVYS